MKLVIRNQEYQLIENYRDSFNESELKGKLEETDYFDNYDYILGDYSYDKLRLKGFYKKDNPNATKINNYENIKEYIDNYCSYGCKYFVLEKKNKDTK